MGIEAERKLELHSPVGADKLLIREFHGAEQLSACFEYVLSLYSENHNIKPEDLLGEHVSIRVRAGGQPERFIDGICCELGHVGSRGRYATYQMVLRPWLWLLSTRSDCRIFQKRSSVEILKEVVAGWGDGTFEIELRVKDAPEEREYCVQYSESDLSFVMRLLEDDGLYFYFEHEKNKHKLIVTDDKSGHKTAPGVEKLSMRKWDSERKDAASIWGWSAKSAVTPGGIAMRDYDYEKARADIDVDRTSPKTKQGRDKVAVIYEYPGHYREVEEGNKRQTTRLEELQANFETAEATTDASGLNAGTLFTLTDHKREVENREYLVTSVIYQADSGAFESGDGAGADFQAKLRCIPTQRPFRPARRTAWPVVPGAQTATVVGHKEGEVTFDEYATVKVHFHWERARRNSKAADPPDDHCSCWVRVAQSWTGAEWGALFLPRVGQEVVVEFLDGNPDRPLITGSVYNNRNQPPYKKASQSGWKTRTLNQTDKSKYNELRFDDEKGREEVHIRAQRDFTTKVIHDSTATVGNDAAHTVKNNLTVNVSEGNHDTVVSKGAMRAEVKDSLYGVTAKEVAVSASDAITLRVGDVSIRIDKTSIALTVDKSAEIKLDLMNLSILGTMVNINPPGVVPLGAAKLPGLLTQMCTPPETETT
jgi:type VI secretion system secreted protein VgrG